jgi:hypothetical protein
MITAHIHAELIAAFFGDDEPCYGECQCAACRASLPRSNLHWRAAYAPGGPVPAPAKGYPASEPAWRHL